MFFFVFCFFLKGSFGPKLYSTRFDTPLNVPVAGGETDHGNLQLTRSLFDTGSSQHALCSAGDERNGKGMQIRF